MLLSSWYYDDHKDKLIFICLLININDNPNINGFYYKIYKFQIFIIFIKFTLYYKKFIIFYKFFYKNSWV